MFKERKREGKRVAEKYEAEGAYPGAHRAATNSRGDCTVRHFIDFNSASIFDEKQSPVQRRYKSIRECRLIIVV